MVEINRILCPIDFSEFSRRALEHAMALARWYGARITVLHVYEVMAVPHGLDVSVMPLASREQLAADLRSFVGPREDAGVPIDEAIEEGRAARVIVATATQLAADLIVMGTHGRGGFEHLMLGSVTEKVLRTAVCPVLTVPPAVTGTSRAVQLKRILCPIDFGPASMEALGYALSLAREADARLVVLHVLEGAVEEPALVPFDVPEYHRLREQQARERLRAAVPADAREWCQPVEMLAWGKPYREILRVARETETELVVMGAVGHGALERLLFGSTTHHVVRQAACPVLTLRAPQKASAEGRAPLQTVGRERA